MNQTVNLIYQCQVNVEFLFLLELCQFQVVNKFQILFFLLLVKIVGVGEHTYTEKQIQ